jgi:Integrase core domain/Homeodomain-like domain
LRRQRHTSRQIAAEVGISPATVSRILRRLGLNRLAALEPAEPVRGCEREHPGEIIHIDIRKLGKFNRIGHRITGDRTGQSNTRGVGWEYLHLAVDDHSRLAYSEILPDEKHRSCLRFLLKALRFFRTPRRQGPSGHDRQWSSASVPTAMPKPCACSRSSICANKPSEHVSIADAEMVCGEISQCWSACHCFVEEAALRFSLPLQRGHAVMPATEMA